MAASTSSLGNCPECGEEINVGAKLIEYERSDGTTGIYADCSGCDRVVRPE